MERGTAMKFTVGYQQREDSSFLKSIIAHKDGIHEVYFAFGDFANGRGKPNEKEGLLACEADQRTLLDLALLREEGIALNILFNANCYGRESESRAFFHRVGDTVDFFVSRYGLASVTTASPLIAKFIKENFENIRVRASVNMEIGTEEGMDYLADRFDSFYMKRELNRNFPAIRRLKKWCDENGKELFMLANSGCLNFCSSHIFHDNLVAHEKEILAMDNAYAYRGTCWEYLAKSEKRYALVQKTNYVRPEDLSLYEGLFTAAKLATRVNASPERVLEAYMAEKYIGSPLELLEPNHAGAIYPLYLDNSRFPSDFAQKVGNCTKDCENCGYCKQVYENAIINLEEDLC